MVYAKRKKELGTLTEEMKEVIGDQAVELQAVIEHMSIFNVPEPRLMVLTMKHVHLFDEKRQV